MGFQLQGDESTAITAKKRGSMGDLEAGAATENSPGKRRRAQSRHNKFKDMGVFQLSKPSPRDAPPSKATSLRPP